MSIAALLQAAEYIERRERGEYCFAACIFTHMCVFFLSPSIYGKFHRGCARMPVCAMSLAHGNERVYRRWISERDLCYYAYPRLVAPSCLQCVFSVS